MDDQAVLDEFRDAGALLEGHFILSSGLRSPRYLQCARVLMDGARAERLARALAGPLGGVSRLDWRAEGLVCDLELPGQVLETAPA